MPELAELKITADYVNRFNKVKFTGTYKNPEHKGSAVILPNQYAVSAESRGKELLITVHGEQGTACLSFNMGMTGYFKWIPAGEERKHVHFAFTTQGGKLAFIDVRRFGSWRQADGWSANRGPDPLTEYESFVRNIMHNLDKTAFNKPIAEVLMNQQYFNGIGNYLRAEILYRADVDPMLPAKRAILEHPSILKMCNSIPAQAYQLGGGQLKDWKNPFNEPTPASWEDFMKCYGNAKMCKVKDGTGRTLWFNPKWKKINI